MRLPLTIKPYGVASNLPPDSQIAPESHLIGGCKYFSQYAIDDSCAIFSATAR
jgi:hypothetical protein